MKHSRWCKQFNQFSLAESILVKILVEVSSIFDYFTTTRQYINMSIVPQNRDIKNIATTSILQAVIDQKDHSAKKTPCWLVMHSGDVQTSLFISFYRARFWCFSSKRSNLLKCNNQRSALNKQLSATPSYTLPLQASLTLSNISSDICLYPGSSLMHAACLSSPHS